METNDSTCRCALRVALQCSFAPGGAFSVSRKCTCDMIKVHKAGDSNKKYSYLWPPLYPLILHNSLSLFASCHAFLAAQIFQTRCIIDSSDSLTETHWTILHINELAIFCKSHAGFGHAEASFSMAQAQLKAMNFIDIIFSYFIGFCTVLKNKVHVDTA